jgi:hypothetical protein
VEKIKTFCGKDFIFLEEDKKAFLYKKKGKLCRTKEGGEKAKEDGKKG